MRFHCAVEYVSSGRFFTSRCAHQTVVRNDSPVSRTGRVCATARRRAHQPAASNAHKSLQNKRFFAFVAQRRDNVERTRGRCHATAALVPRGAHHEKTLKFPYQTLNKWVALFFEMRRMIPSWTQVQRGTCAKHELRSLLFAAAPSWLTECTASDLCVVVSAELMPGASGETATNCWLCKEELPWPRKPQQQQLPQRRRQPPRRRRPPRRRPSLPSAGRW